MPRFFFVLDAEQVGLPRDRERAAHALRPRLQLHYPLTPSRTLLGDVELPVVDAEGPVAEADVAFLDVNEPRSPAERV